MVVCCVPGCETGTAAYKKRLKENGEPSISLFRVPRNPNVLKSWEQAIPKLNEKPLSYQWHVCALHFRPENVITHYETKLPDGTINIIPRGRTLLKSGAVPINCPNIPFSNLTINRDPLELSEINSNKGKYVSLSPTDDGGLLNNGPTVEKVNSTLEAFVKSELEEDSISINESINDTHREAEPPELSEITSDERKHAIKFDIKMGAVLVNSPFMPSSNSIINREPPELSKINTNKRKHVSLSPNDDGVLLNNDSIVEKLNSTYYIVEAFVKSELEEESISINELINDTGPPKLSEIASDERKQGLLRPINVDIKRGVVPVNSPIMTSNSTINREPPKILSKISSNKRKHASLRSIDFLPKANEGVLLNVDPTVKKVNSKFYIVELDAFVKSEVKSELEEDSFSINNLISDTNIKIPSKMWAKTYIGQNNEVIYAEWDECYCPRKKLIVASDLSFKVVLGATEIKLNKPFTKITKYEDVEDLIGTIHEINL